MLRRLLTAVLAMGWYFLGCAAFAQGRTVTVDPAFLRGAILLQMGDTLQIFLKANAGAGYTWQVTRNNPALLQPLGGPIAQARGNNPYHVMRFRAVQVGVVRLELIYRNPALKNVPRDRFRSSVAINLPAPSRKVIVTEKDHGKPVSLVIGDILSVRLPVDVGQGFRWVPVGNLNIALRPIRTFMQGPGNELPSGYVFQVFHYQALATAVVNPMFQLQDSTRRVRKDVSFLVTIQPPTAAPLPIQSRNSNATQTGNPE